MSSVVGLDLGCQNSVIAAAGRGGVDVILNGNSNRLNPSMIGFAENRKIGEQALSGEKSNIKNTIKAMKRMVGLPYDSRRAKSEMKYCYGVNFCRIARTSGGGSPDSIGVQVTLNGEDMTIPIEHVLAMMVKHMGDIAAEKAAADVANTTGTTTTPNSSNNNKSLFPQDWVIAIPNYYTDAQRRAVLAGCEVVGINGVLRLMHENTATALAYGIFKDLKKEFTADQPTNVLFIDMGASAYTVSITSFVPGKLIVKSEYCDPDLGGRDFDMLIANWINNEFKKKHGRKLSGDPMERPKSRLKILMNAEKAKKTLSPQGVKEARLNLEMLMDDLDFSISLKADVYEEMCQPLLDRLEEPIQKALAEAGLTAGDLASVEIVGGSTRIGCVKRKLCSVLGISQLSTTMNADESVARGATLQSAILSPRFKVLPYEIQEAQPYPITLSWDDHNQAAGVEVSENDDMTPTDSVTMFDRGHNFPVVRRVTLRRSGEFNVKASYDPNAAMKEYNLPPPSELADFTIKAPPGEANKVRVNVKQDIHGIVLLSSAQMVEEIVEEAEPAAADDDAKADGEGKKEEGKEGEEAAAAPEPEKKKKTKKTNLDFTTRRPLEWTKAEISKYNESEVHMANNDRIVKETADMRNELESYIYDMRDKVMSESHLGQYGTESEKAAFNTANEAMENWLYEDGFDATKKVYAEKLAELKKLGTPMEQRQAENQMRPNSVQTLKANLERYQQWVNESQTQERYSHITDEEREKVRELCDQISSWMYDMLDQQGSLALNQDPVLTVAATHAKNLELNNTCSPIMNKAKPPPPKKKEPEPKKEEETPAADAEPMEGVEKEGEAAAKSNGEDASKMEVDA